MNVANTTQLHSHHWIMCLPNGTPLILYSECGMLNKIVHIDDEPSVVVKALTQAQEDGVVPAEADSYQVDGGKIVWF